MSADLKGPKVCFMEDVWEDILGRPNDTAAAVLIGNIHVQICVALTAV